MENLINITNIQILSFPVFKIGIHEPQLDQGLVYYYFEKELYTENGTTKKLSYQVIDDRNLNHATLSRRRLQLKSEGVKLAQISNAVYFLGDLIKLADRKTWFIDSIGNIFKYKKSNRAKLHFYKIENLIPITTGGVIVVGKNLNTRFKSLYAPAADKTHIGVLHFNKTHILYGFYNQAYDSTWRMI